MKQVYVGSTPVREVYVGSEKVWPVGPRTVTINGSAAGWNQATATGDTGLIQEWIGRNRVRFHAPTRCNQDVYNTTAGLILIDAGSTIPAGTPVQPFMYNGAYTFTEVL